MGELVHADIFFFITAVATVVLTLLAVAVFVYLLKILRDARETVKAVRRQAERVSEDIDAIRERMRNGEKSIRRSLKFSKFVATGRKVWRAISEEKKEGKKNARL